MARGKVKLNLRLTKNADAALREIWRWNAENYGETRADRYIERLYNEMKRLTVDPSRGRPIEGFPNLGRLLMKPKAKGHGHMAIFHVVEGVLEILFIYHTAQDWQTRLGDESSLRHTNKD